MLSFYDEEKEKPRNFSVGGFLCPIYFAELPLDKELNPARPRTNNPAY